MAITLAGFEASLHRHMPAGAYRDFCLWGISADNPHQETFLQKMGITQLVNMTVQLLDGLVDDQSWHQLLPFCATMNTYQIYEIVSDNLAIGLAASLTGNSTERMRRELLGNFNKAMISRLKGDPTPAVLVLDGIRASSGYISLFEQSLTKESQFHLTDAYLSEHTAHSGTALEYSLWPLLVANIEACADLVQTITPYDVGPLVHDGIIRRYQAVNQSLATSSLPLAQRAEIATHAILVIPTLAYYVSVLAEVIRPNCGLSQVLKEGTLSSALYDAALLVRLLNDFGTTLLTLPAVERDVLMDRLVFRCKEPLARHQTVADVLLAVAEEDDLLTRIRKDIVFGEFNLAMSDVYGVQTVTQGMRIFGSNLSYCSQLYSDHYCQLLLTLDRLNEQLQDDVVSQLILRFVHFHMHLYSKPYTMMAGEYAI